MSIIHICLFIYTWLFSKTNQTDTSSFRTCNLFLSINPKNEKKTLFFPSITYLWPLPRMRLGRSGRARYQENIQKTENPLFLFQRSINLRL